ncbi:MAG: aspartate kinase, partial [Chloroflexi bacterium]|nr:aspartate kinase [Chloroflexota bacterium]
MPHERPLVMKFGGTSVGTPEAMAQVVEIVDQAQRTWQPAGVVVVTSALAGVTDRLLAGVQAAARGEHDAVPQARAWLAERHRAMLEALIPPMERPALWGQIETLLETFAQLGWAMTVLGEATPRALDAVASLGERMSAPILAAALRARGLPATMVDARELLVTDAHFGAAHPLIEPSRERIQTRLRPLLEQGHVVVVPGFIAATEDGITTTLGRGGSDYSAALLGALLPAEEVWIWTDVDGVMSADPRLVPDAHTIPELSYREVAELAYFGAKVLHPKTIRPVVEANIPLRVRNTFHPESPGTLIRREREAVPGQIKALTVIWDLSMVTVEGRGMLGVPGVAARTFAAVASTDTSVLMITQASSEQSISFIIPRGRGPQVKAALEETFARELARQDIDRIHILSPVAIVTVVGEGMRETPGVAGRIFGALGRAGINVIAIAQGASEVALSLVVAEDEALGAVQTLHPLTKEGAA